MPDECAKGLPGVLLNERLLHVCSELVDLLRHHGRDQRVLGRKASKDGGVSDPCLPGDLVDADVAAALGEERGCRVEDALEVALRVRAKRGATHAAGTGAAAASASIVAPCSLPSRARIVTRPAVPHTAAAPNAQWKPVTSASGSVGPPAAVVLLAAIVERIASPSAPPICCEVLKSPEARPWSSSFRPVVAINVSGMKTAPIPSEVTISAGRTSEED